MTLLLILFKSEIFFLTLSQRGSNKVLLFGLCVMGMMESAKRTLERGLESSKCSRVMDGMVVQNVCTVCTSK